MGVPAEGSVIKILQSSSESRQIPAMRRNTVTPPSARQQVSGLPNGSPCNLLSFNHVSSYLIKPPPVFYLIPGLIRLKEKTITETSPGSDLSAGIPMNRAFAERLKDLEEYSGTTLVQDNPGDIPERTRKRRFKPLASIRKQPGFRAVTSGRYARHITNVKGRSLLTYKP